MLTLCHRLTDGTETIISAQEVTHTPDDTVSYRAHPAADIEIELRAGTVFVMNQFGKTVARYMILPKKTIPGEDFQP